MAVRISRRRHRVVGREQQLQPEGSEAIMIELKTILVPTDFS